MDIHDAYYYTVRNTPLGTVSFAPGRLTPISKTDPPADLSRACGAVSSPKVIMPRFQTVIRRARFVYSPYTATEMQGFAQVLADSIRARIQSGQNIYDQAAAPLKPGLAGRRGYPDYKAARGLNPIRDWTWSGHTLRCLKVLTANENRAAIGFLDEALPGRRMTASQIAFFNNRREAQWGVSPRDRQAVLAAFQARPFVMLKAA